MEQKFIKELYDFFVFLKNNTNESEQLTNIIKNYKHLNFKKISEFIYVSCINDKVDILKHNTELFLNDKIYFPTLNISPIVNNMNPTQLNDFWEKFCRIFIYSQCLTTNINVKSAEDADFSIEDLINEYKEQNNTTDPTLLDLFFDGELLNKKIKEATITDFTEFTDKLGNILPMAKDEKFKQQLNDVIKDIFYDLKKIDFTKNSVMTIVQSLAKKFAEKLNLNSNKEFTTNIINMMSDFMTSIKSGGSIDEIIKDADPETKEMINMTTDFIKKTDLKNNDINKIMTDFSEYAASSLPDILKKKNLPQKKINEIMANPKNYGIDPKHISMNRKIKRQLSKK